VERGHESQFVAHIPADYAGAVEGYIRKLVARKAGTPSRSDALAIEVSAEAEPVASLRVRGRAVRIAHDRAAQHAAEALERHWGYVRGLCRGLDRAVRGRDEVGVRRPLLDLLGVPATIRRPAGVIAWKRRFAVSNSIGDDAWRRAEECGLSYLSAFRDGAWSRLADGWELHEHRDRQREEAERHRREQNIVSAPLGGDWRQAELDRMRTSWPKDPRARRRSWDGWWPTPSREDT
jgi:hypothetical protein